MATYRTYKKKDGTVSVTAIIRKKGLEVLTETFTETKSGAAKSEAQAWASDIERRIRFKKHKDPRTAKVSIGYCFDEYFKMLQITGRKKAKTVQGEKWSRNQIEKYFGEEAYVSDVTTAKMAKYRDMRLRSGVGASKIRSEIALISSLFKFLIQERELPVENPVASGKLWRPKAPKGKIDFLSEQEIKSMMSACRKSKNKKLACYVSVLINTGMRPGEAATLLVRDIDIKKKSVLLVESKNGESRLIPLTAAAFREIAPFIIGRKSNEYIFHKGTELPINYQKRPASMFREAFDAAKKKAGVERITRHGLRHTAASHMLKSGISLRVIAEVLGHRTLQMAMRYTHPDEAVLREAVETLGDLAK